MTADDEEIGSQPIVEDDEIEDDDQQGDDDLPDQLEPDDPAGIVPDENDQDTDDGEED